MTVSPYESEEDRRRLADQLELLREAHGERVAWDSENPEDVSYLYDPDALLVRSDERDRVDDVLRILNEAGDFAGEVAEDAFPADESGRPALPLTRVVLPGRVDGDPRRVPLALDVLDAQGVNTDAVTVVTPDHWLHLSPGTGRLCPANEPEETGLTDPWPPVAQDRSLGKGVRVSVVDSGWHAPAAQRAPTMAWLGGVDGDPEPSGPTLGAYAGHGTFIAGVVRCRAPSAEVYVERFPVAGAAILESAMVAQLREALARRPQLISLSAGAVSRQDRPLLSFEVFYEQDLKHEKDCLLFAAAGNDATSTPFWPAAFDWAVGVGSLDHDGRVSSFSNYGRSADVYALGRNVVNAFPDGTYVCRETPEKGDVRVFKTGMARWSGTSFATPLVVGLVAAETSAAGGVHAAWTSVRGRAGTADDPDGVTVAALLPPYT